MKNKCLQSGKLFGWESKVTISQGAREEFEKFYTKWFLKRSPVRVEATEATISAIDTSSIQTPKDMVFSQTSHKTQNLIQVIELDRLKAEKNQQVNESIALDIGSAMASNQTAGNTFTEVYLKSEPLDQNEMMQEMDFEFFQNLPSFITEPDHQHMTESVQKIENEALYKNTPNTPLSPQSWEALDTNSPSIQASLYKNTSEHTGFDAKLLSASADEDLIQCPEQFLDINSLPVVIGDLASEIGDISSWQTTQSADWTHIHNTDYTKTDTLNKVPLIHDDDSQEWKCMTTVMPREVENNNVVIEEYVINDVGVAGEGFGSRVGGGRGLSVNVSSVPSWHTDLISTPEVLRTVEQLEKQKFPIIDPVFSPKPWVPDDSIVATREDVHTTIGDYEPITPKSEYHIDSEDDHSTAGKRKRRRRHDSEDSDETYTPYTEETPRRKYRRRKSSIPIEEKIRALESSQQQPKARRGRPPKRRESNISSVCSIDENSSTTSTHELKYREQRDKNNEASKRSRMNRKLKELQMEKYADELEERNSKLKIKADILEDMTKRLKSALMTAILQK